MDRPKLTFPRQLLFPLLLCLTFASAQTPKPTPTPPGGRLVIADQDASGPGGSDMAALLVLLQSPKAHLLGITVVTGDAGRDEEVAHALRLLEIVGRTDLKVYPGAVVPLVRTEAWTRLNQQMYGKVTWMGAWRESRSTASNTAPSLQEGAPTTLPAEEDAAHFMVRTVHQYPHQVTIYAAGPLTNIALALRLDPHFAELAQELVVMGGSLAPRSEAHEWYNRPRHEFNFWFDPEAASITLNAPWPKITVTTVDASVQTKLSGVLAAMQGSPAIPARYLIQYSKQTGASDIAWDELAAATWLDPSITVHARDLLMDVDIDHGALYGETLTWSEFDKPALPHQIVHAQVDVDAPRLERDLIELFTSPTPGAHNPRPLPAPSK